MIASPPLKLAISGVNGRMGQALLQAIDHHPSMILTGILSRTLPSPTEKTSLRGLDTRSEIAHTDDPSIALAEAAVLIDFTRPIHALNALAACRQYGVNMVVGTTGFTDAEKQVFVDAASDIAILMSPNMSIGVNLLLTLLPKATQALSTDYDIEIMEMHHRGKIDAPSGTALRFGETIATARGSDLKQTAIYSREGNTGARPANAIGFSTMRGGDVVGDHTVVFAGDGERIEFTHKASSRSCFAQGALRAAEFLATKKCGLYDMQNALNLL